MANTDPVLAPSPITKDLLDARGGVNLGKICQLLGIQAAELGRLTRRTTESVAKAVAVDDYVLLREEQTLSVARQLVQIVAILRAMGMVEGAERWMHTPIPTFEGQTPLEIIGDGRGQELVSRLMGLATGGVGG